MILLHIHIFLIMCNIILTTYHMLLQNHIILPILFLSLLFTILSLITHPILPLNTIIHLMLLLDPINLLMWLLNPTLLHMLPPSLNTPHMLLL